MKRLVLIIGGVVFVLILAGAAFVAARMLTGPEAPSGGGGRQMVMKQNNGGSPVQIGLKFERAPELPDTPPEAAGLFVRREDNSIFVGTGDIEVSVDADETGQENVSTDFSGPVLEVVVTRDTTLYRDETDMPNPSGAQSGEVTVQQVVQPVDSLDEIGENNPHTELQVWGTRSGDRIVAQVLVYRLLGLS